jgi:hypothetical protein
MYETSQNMNLIKKLRANKLKLIIYFVFLFGLVGVVTYSAWEAPTAVAPFENRPEPLDVSIIPQVKNGDLTITNGRIQASTVDEDNSGAIIGIHSYTGKAGIYGQTSNPNGYAGQFVGKVRSEGDYKAFCFENDCISSWSEIGGLWQSDTNGITYNEVGMNVAIGAAPVVGDNRLQVTGDASVTGELTVTKLTAATIDPVYWIDDVSYSTYGHSTTGIKEETMGKVELNNHSNGIYSFVIDFDNLEKGSDLWLFKQIIVLDKDWNDLIVALTPEGRANVWYELNPDSNQLIIYSNSDIKVSYRLVAPRFDWPEINTNLSDVEDRNIGLKIR